MLSGYRLMWIIALFDLPVVTKAERKKAKSRAVANSGDSDLSEILG